MVSPNPSPFGGARNLCKQRLRKAVSTAKSNNIPLDKIERAIKKGTGELDGIQYEDMIYEGYGPYGIAIILEVITDNKNRSVAEIRHVFSKKLPLSRNLHLLCLNQI